MALDESQSFRVGVVSNVNVMGRALRCDSGSAAIGLLSVSSARIGRILDPRTLRGYLIATEAMRVV